ncbi:SMP-30/gluconolactonase/LRE family protein [Novosphingobium arvoryzae]|uniref:Gluconolactonase n=1 Tax=Novosphingobium arvoryzae TaxID=1256514 RepID=A0A918VAP1_9SPHN|nr:SMP-30/gluconolactonase/LRE family protein [Novosphingobium arvoryzae]GGZ85713.1 gluconolactonase [Novosphingobium arvoryzae]
MSGMLSSLPAAQLYDDRACTLGEGAFWHPLRQQLFWFDIVAGQMHTRDANGPHLWQFDGPVSAAGWIDTDTLLVAGSGALMRFDLGTGRSTCLATLDCAGGQLRPNDGRADPQGGFWIGTMGLAAERHAGAILRWYRGVMRRVVESVTIPNAICFGPTGDLVCFTDTVTRIVHRQRLDPEGWPTGAPEPWLDLRAEGLNPDGAVIDGAGRLWLAQWGAGRVAAYDPAGRLVGSVSTPVPHASCPAFGGPELATLFVTTAREGMDAAALAAAPQAGMTFAVDLAAYGVRGQAEHRVIA